MSSEEATVGSYKFEVQRKQFEMQQLRSRFSVVDGRNQALQKEVDGLRAKLTQAPSTEIAMPPDGLQMISGRQVLPWSQRLMAGRVESTGAEVGYYRF
eukprot:1102808-Amphidinium_carterae.2